MFHINVTSINVPNSQKDLYHYIVQILFDNVLITEKHHNVFRIVSDTVEDAIRLATSYNSRDGVFQEKVLKQAHDNYQVTHTYLVDDTTKYSVDTYGKLTKI